MTIVLDFTELYKNARFSYKKNSEPEIKYF